MCVYYDLSREGIVEIRVKIIQQGNNKERILSIKQFLKICIVERDESNNNALVIKEKIREKTKKKRIYIWISNVFETILGRGISSLSLLLTEVSVEL